MICKKDIVLTTTKENMITYNVIDIKMPDISHRETTAWVRAVAASYGKRVGEVAYVFCNDEKILEVNRQYLKHDYYTERRPLYQPRYGAL